MEALKERRVSFSVEAEVKAKNVKHTRRWRQRNESGEEAVAIVTEGDWESALCWFVFNLFNISVDQSETLWEVDCNAEHLHRATKQS